MSTETTAKYIADSELKELILLGHSKLNGIYGYRRTRIWLEQKHGIKYNHKRVYRLMSCLGIKAVIRRKKKHFGGAETIIVTDNILNRDFKASKPNTKWVTDITYLIFNGRRLYLSVILDLYNKEIVAFNVSRSNDLQLVLATVKKAAIKREVNGILLDSDQGFQYTSKQYKSLLKSSYITQSMSWKGNYLNNAAMECFWGNLKSELMYLNKFKEDQEVIQAVSKYIDFYNNERFQAKLNNLTPVEFRCQAKIA